MAAGVFDKEDVNGEKSCHSYQFLLDMPKRDMGFILHTHR